MMNKIVIITYFDDVNRDYYKELYKRGIIEKLYTPDEINESKIVSKIETFPPNSTILIHSSTPFNIDRENIYYFSFGCQSCENEIYNGDILKDIVNNIDKYSIYEIEKRFGEFRSVDYKEAKNFLSNYKDVDNIEYKVDNTFLYISDRLSMPIEIRLIFEKIKRVSKREEIIKRLELNREEYIYLLVPFMGYGYPKIDSLDSINRYFLDLKNLQELANYRIIFLFLAYSDDYIPDFFKEKFENKSKINTKIDITFISPLKKFNQDNHIKFIFAELIYRHNKKDKNKKEVLNFFKLDSLSNSSIVAIEEYLKNLHNYKEIKKIYYNNLFLNEKYVTDRAVSEYRECWSRKLDLQYHDIKENFHDFDLPDIRTNMPFYLASIFNKLLLIENTLKSQKIDFLLIDDEDTIKEKESSIVDILNTLLGKDNYIFSKKEFNKDNFYQNIDDFTLSSKYKNIKNSNFILLDFILDRDGLFFGSDFIEKVEKYKKEKDKLFRSWYFITSFLSGYINKFEMDKILYEYYETTNVQLGDSTQEKHRIFFIKKLVYFIYSKINIYIRIHDISKKIQKEEMSNDLIKKLIILMQDLLKQIDLLELRYGKNLEAPQQFYTLTISILDNYLQKIEYQWEIREIKYQELKRIKERLNPKNNQEINQIFLLIQALYFRKKEG